MTLMEELEDEYAERVRSSNLQQRTDELVAAVEGLVAISPQYAAGDFACCVFCKFHASRWDSKKHTDICVWLALQSALAACKEAQGKVPAE